MISTGNGRPNVPAEDLKMLAAAEKQGRPLHFKGSKGGQTLVLDDEPPVAGNGHAAAQSEEPAPLPAETITAMIGGEPVEVPELSWMAFKKLRPFLENAAQNTDWVADRDATVRMISIALEGVRPDLTEEAIQQRITLREALVLGITLTKLMALSGVNQPGEAVAASG